MYRQPGITGVATALESCARAVREGRLTWTPPLHAALVATIDDLRILVRDVRHWSTESEQRANARAAELEALVPRAPTPSTAVQAATEAGGRAYLGLKTRELGATLARVSADPTDASARAALERDVRVLSGVALLKEYPVLARVVSGIERQCAAMATRAPGDDARALLRRTANALASSAAALESGEPSDAQRILRDVASELDGEDAPAGGERVVAIDELFYGDEGPTVVEPSPAPPQSAAQRFRIEIVGLAEHARRVIGDVRRAPDDSERDRGWRSLERAFSSLVDTARSFGESAVAGALGAWERAVASREQGSLDALDRAASALADPHLPGSTLEQRLQELGGSGQPPTGAAEPPSPPVTETDTPEAPPHSETAEPTAARPASPEAKAPEPSPRRTVRPTPTGVELREMLASGIDELGQLDRRPLTPPVPLPQERVVPIETLLYRGDSALRRAREIREEIKAGGGTASPEHLDELFALLDLVQTK
jgi:hypothetical protein